MESKNINRKAIMDVYKNAHIALQSISDLLPNVNDDELKDELKLQYEGYSKIIDEVSNYLCKNNIEPEDVGVFQKAMMKGSIKFKTLINDSKNHVAEMMIKGTVMGITELAAMKNEDENYDDSVKLFITKLLNLEEEYEQRLKKFL